MPSRVTPGPVESDASIREAVCVHTNKIFDSCRDKDCIEDLRVYLTSNALPAIDGAVSIRSRSAELLYAAPDVKPVSFNRGYYTVDIRFFYKITGEISVLTSNSLTVTGLAIFDKRVLLFGSEGNAKVFSSVQPLGGITENTIKTSNLPTAIVEAVDPIILDMKIMDTPITPALEGEILDIPDAVAAAFDTPVSLTNCSRRVYVTLGQFSIVRLERDSQLLIPAYDYCMPDKECAGFIGDDPCTLFSKIEFPVDEFFPPDALSNPECYREIIENNTVS